MKSVTMCRRRVLKTLGTAALSTLVAPGRSFADVVERNPRHHRVEVLVSSAEFDDRRYLAFPALVDLGDQVLVSFKRGRSHASDPGATLDLLRIDPTTGLASRPRTIAQLDDHIMQMGEWVRFANGHIANYIDAQSLREIRTGTFATNDFSSQRKASGLARAGLRVVRSTDGGKTFGPVERVGVVDGVEYGYAFGAIVEPHATWMLAMTFSNLTGGRSVYAPRPHAGSVDVIRSDDHGKSWHFVRNLSHEFGDVPINESTFIRHGDGFLVSTRGYDDRQRVHLTDASFRVLRPTDLTAAHPFITSHVGRPRLFAHDGNVYLLGRNWPHAPRAMQLGLFRLDPDTLNVAAYSVLDNAERAPVFDGYYAMPYFRTSGAEAMMYVVTYQGVRGQPAPDIVRHEYRWDEVK